MAERLLPGLKNRWLQMLARSAPGATSVRVRLNRWRGVNIGKDVWIGYDAIIETSHPHLVTIRDRAAVGIRATIIAHNREQQGVVIEEDAVRDIIRPWRCGSGGRLVIARNPGRATQGGVDRELGGVARRRGGAASVY